MVICLERGADLHMAQLMPLPLTVSCFSKMRIGFTFLVPAHLGSPGKGPFNGGVCVCDICVLCVAVPPRLPTVWKVCRLIRGIPQLRKILRLITTELALTEKLSHASCYCLRQAGRSSNLKYNKSEISASSSCYCILFS